MTSAHGPIAGRRRLRTVLRRARESSALTQESVAQSMEWSLSKLIRIENGSVSISTNDLRALLDLYGIADKSTITELVELARIGRARPWWTDYREHLSSAEFRTLIGLEGSASTMRIFNQNVFSGLLQAEQYARTILRDVIPELPEGDLQTRVKVRLRRQIEVFDRIDPPDVSVLIDEAALRRAVQEPGVMRAQLHHLQKVAERPHVSLRIVPFSAGVYQLVSSFSILSFPDGDDPDMVYVDSYFNEDLLEDPERVSRYHDAFTTLETRALDTQDSIALIQKAADELA